MTRHDRLFFWCIGALWAVAFFLICAAAMAQTIPPYVGLPAGNATVIDQQGGPADAATFYINRNALYIGGTPGFTNSALHVGARVGAGATAFEWPILCTLESAGAGENACVYSQAIATGAVPVWAYAADCQDRSPSAHAAVMPCVETRTTGGHVVIGHDIVIGGNPDLAVGARIGPPDADVAGAAQIDIGVQFRGKFRNAAIVAPANGYLFRSDDYAEGIWLGNGLILFQVGKGRLYAFAESGAASPALFWDDGSGRPPVQLGVR